MKHGAVYVLGENGLCNAANGVMLEVIEAERLSPDGINLRGSPRFIIFDE